MAWIECTHQREVTHIGFLDTPENRKPSLDGPGVSVSTCPESWRAMRGLNGPEIRLIFSAAQWVDAMTLSDADMASIFRWAIHNRYMLNTLAWHALVEEGGDMIPKAFPDRASAAAAAGRTLAAEVEAHARGEGACWEEDTFQLTPRGMKALERWPDPLDNSQQAAILLYVRKVVIPKRPYVVGVWWSEPNRPDMGCAPSGVLFPERLHHFQVEDEGGEVHPFSERFPEFPLPKDPIVRYD